MSRLPDYAGRVAISEPIRPSMVTRNDPRAFQKREVIELLDSTFTAPSDTPSTTIFRSPPCARSSSNVSPIATDGTRCQCVVKTVRKVSAYLCNVKSEGPSRNKRACAALVQSAAARIHHANWHQLLVLRGRVHPAACLGKLVTPKSTASAMIPLVLASSPQIAKCPDS